MTSPSTRLAFRSALSTVSLLRIGLTCSSLLAVASSSYAQVATFYGPTPYLQASDSPFFTTACPDFVIDTFEPSMQRAVGVVPSHGLILPPSSNTDSVDADDGSIDGSGTAGHSWWSNYGVDGSKVMRFSFTSTSVPTIAGLVWTDCYTPTNDFATFEAFDTTNTSLGTIGPIAVGDGSPTGGTAEDRFFGVQYSGGIRAIEIRMATSNNFEIDHLQFGCFTSPMVPFCFPETAGVRPCPCNNPPVPNDGTRGCNNFGPNPAGGTGGAILSASGVASAGPSNSLVFHVTDMQTPCSLVVFFGGSVHLSTGVQSGGGVRCVSSLITPRMYKTVSAFNAGAVDFPSIDSSPNADAWTRSNMPASGTTLYYFATYRNGQAGSHAPCTPATAFNTTNAGAVVWHL